MLLYQTLKNLRKKKTTRATSIKKFCGNLVTDEGQIMDRWKQHFEDLLRSSQQEDRVSQDREENENVGVIHQLMKGS